MIDVTVPLQCLVKDSKLILTEASKVDQAQDWTERPRGSWPLGMALWPFHRITVLPRLTPTLRPHGSSFLPVSPIPPLSKRLLTTYCVQSNSTNPLLPLGEHASPSAAGPSSPRGIALASPSPELPGPFPGSCHVFPEPQRPAASFCYLVLSA